MEFVDFVKVEQFSPQKKNEGPRCLLAVLCIGQSDSARLQ